jgi:hypothetical protein
LTFTATARLLSASVHRLTIAAGVIFIVSACALAGSVRASDLQTKAPLRVAALGDAAPLPSRGPQRAIDALQLAQSLALPNPEEPLQEDLVIVAIDASQPDSLAEAIATEHKLEITRRLAMTSIGMRIISYRRLLDAQPIAAILERLRADDRVTSAQINVAYRPLPAEPTRVTNVPPEQRPAPNKERQKPAGPRSSGKAALASTAQDAARSATVPMRIADVLAGGL